MYIRSLLLAVGLGGRRWELRGGTLHATALQRSLLPEEHIRIMPLDTLITLSIRETGTSANPVFLYHVYVDRQVIVLSQSLVSDQTQGTRWLARRYQELFVQQRGPRLARDRQWAIGAELFTMWLAPVWQKIVHAIPYGAHATLVIASEEAEILNLPWELLYIPEGDHLGLNAQFGIRRFPHSAMHTIPQSSDTLHVFSGKLPPRPLRVLCISCAPQDYAVLDYEYEEEVLQAALANAGKDVVYEICESGTFSELCQRIAQVKPHIVHLVGYAVIRGDGLGYIAFEDEHGKTAMRSTDDLAQVVQDNHVQCVIINSGQSSTIPPIETMNSIAQQLVYKEVPLALAWVAPLTSNASTRFMRVFYKLLASSYSLDNAIIQARKAIRNICDLSGDPTWTQPVLYASTTQQQLFNRRALAEYPPHNEERSYHPLPALSDGIVDAPIGQRRIFQRVLPALQDGTKPIALITGGSGSGKSVLATAIARRLQTDNGLIPIAMSACCEPMYIGALLVQRCSAVCQQLGYQTAYAMLTDPKVTLEDRLQRLVTVLNQHPFVLVLDGFNIHIDIGEQSGDGEHAREHDGEYARTPLGTFYRELFVTLTGQSRVLITSRYPPVDVGDIPTLFPLVHEEALGEMARAHVVRFLLSDAAIRGRYRNGDLKLEVLHTLYTILNGTPRFLLQIRQALRDIPPALLHDALSSHIPFSSTDSLPSKLQQIREQFCLHTFVQYLYDKLEPESQQALSRAAVYPVPVPMTGLVAVTGIPHDGLAPMVRQWQELVLIAPIAAAGYKRYAPSNSNEDVLWVVVAHIRGWLLDTSRLSQQEADAARSAAGQFLYRQVTDTMAPLSEELRDEWLMHAYRLYSTAGDYAQAREVVGYLSHRYRLRGYYTEVELLNQAVLDYEQHPAPMVWIGRAQSELGNGANARAWFESALAQAQRESPDASHYPGEAARAWYELGRLALQQGKELTARQAFEHALEQYQQAELDAGEAAAWHQLALLEMNQGNDGAAFEKFCAALRKEQQTGNREAEARLFYELGVLAAKQGSIENGLRLSMLSLLILRGIGHEDQQNIEAGVNALMVHLGYSQEQFAVLVQDVEQAYREDGGWGVLQG